MAKRAPRHVNPAAPRRPGRPPMPSPTASRASALTYLVKRKISPEVAKALWVWFKTAEKHRAPAPARQWRSEARAVQVGSKRLLGIAARWSESGELDPAKPLLAEVVNALTKLSRIASFVEKRRRTGASDVLRRADRRLRFATTLAQVEPAFGLHLRAREVAALAVVHFIERPTGDEEDAERRCLQNWERTWKTAQRLAAALRRSRPELSKQVPAAPRANGVG